MAAIRWKPLSIFAALPLVVDKLNRYFAASDEPVTVSGSRANPEQALKSLIRQLAAKGIIIDDTTV